MFLYITLICRSFKYMYVRIQSCLLTGLPGQFSQMSISVHQSLSLFDIQKPKTHGESFGLSLASKYP